MTDPRESEAREVLAACPFCGESERIEAVSDGVTEWNVCRRCGCDGPVSRNAEQRIAAWNTRAAPTPPATSERQEVEDLVRVAAWNAAKNEGCSDETGYRVVEAIVAATAALARADNDAQTRIASFLTAIMDQSPNGETVEVKYHPDGDWTVYDRAGGDGWRPIADYERDCETEIDMWCESLDGDGWNLRGVLMIGTPDWVKRADATDYWPHENGCFITHFRPLPAAPDAEGR